MIVNWIRSNWQVPLAAGGTAAIVAILVRLLVGPAHAWTGADAAAWVQAIGSIAAIVAAWTIANRQNTEAVAREARASAARTLAVSRLVSILRVRLHSELEMWKRREQDGGRVSDLSVMRMKAAREHLVRFPLNTLESDAAVLLVVDAMDVADLAVELLEQTRTFFQRSEQAGVHAICEKLPILERLATEAAAHDDRLRDIAEPGWQKRLPHSAP